MKYYSLKYKPGPGKSPGNQKLWRIEIDSKYKHDKGLLAHEVCHVQQWYAAMFAVLLIASLLSFLVVPAWGLLAIAAPFAQQALYRVKAIRILMELQCYRAQIKAWNYTNNEFAVRAMVGHGMGENKARKALE